MDIEMSAAEIILVVIGAAIFLLGYLMPARKKDMDEEVQLISEDEIRKLIANETEQVKDKIADIVDETVSYSVEKTERAMERLTNEKIMAINEYSDTVLEEINKNHKEVVFLYDMLNDKHDNLMAVVNEASATSEGVKQTLKDAEVTVHEAMDKADEVLHAVNEASARINDVLRAADDAVKGVWDAQNAARVAREAAQEAIRIASELTESKKTGIEMLSEVKAAREKKPGTVQDVAVPDGTGIDEAYQPDQLDDQIEPENLQETEPDEEMTEQEFKPILPKRVEIIHEPDEDDTESGERDMAVSGISADLGILAPKTGAEEIQFAKDNGRNSNERILDLHKAGKSNMAIAKELGLGLGEVKLVIDLFEGM